MEWISVSFVFVFIFLVYFISLLLSRGYGVLILAVVCCLLFPLTRYSWH